MALTQDTLMDFLANTLHVDTADISAESELFSSGHIDSFSMIDLIEFIEATCNTRIKPAEITLDNLDTIARILAFLSDRPET